MYWDVLGCFRMFRGVLWDVLERFGLFGDFLDILWVFFLLTCGDVLGGFKAFGEILGCF